MYKDQGCILGFSEAPLTLFICVYLNDLRPESGKYVFKNQMKGNQVIVAYKVLNVCLALLKWCITSFNPQSSLTDRYRSYPQISDEQHLHQRAFIMCFRSLR